MNVEADQAVGAVLLCFCFLSAATKVFLYFSFGLRAVNCVRSRTTTCSCQILQRNYSGKLVSVVIMSVAWFDWSLIMIPPWKFEDKRRKSLLSHIWKWSQTNKFTFFQVIFLSSASKLLTFQGGILRCIGHNLISAESMFTHWGQKIMTQNLISLPEKVLTLCFVFFIWQLFPLLLFVFWRWTLSTTKGWICTI